MERIGILGAMPEEIAQLYTALSDRKESKQGGVTFYEGNLGGKHAILCCAGMGKVNAAAATQLLITAYGAQAIVFSGIAGNMSGRIGLGEVVIGDTVLYHDAETAMIAQAYPHLERFRADAALVAAAEKACRVTGTPYMVGTIATGDRFVGDTATKLDIAARCAPDCVEMEGAAVAHIAAKNDVPFAVVRAMSDDADEDAAEKLVGKPFDISAYCSTAAHICAEILRAL